MQKLQANKEDRNIDKLKGCKKLNLNISGKAKHGEKVTILDKSGNGVKIKTASGVTG